MLTRQYLRDFCLSRTGAVEEFPFGPDAAVFKVRGKLFAILPLDADPQTISLKCDPIEVPLLREMYNAVQPGYHLNKKHWNTVIVGNDLPDELLLEMIEDSYVLVRQKLKKVDREALEQIEAE